MHVYPERTGACGLEVGSCEGEARPQLAGGYYLETLWSGGLPEVGAEKGGGSSVKNSSGNYKKQAMERLATAGLGAKESNLFQASQGCS